MYEFKLPDLGEGIHEAEILKWHVGVGDVVQEDAPLVDVETDKATVTIPSPASGRVTKLGGAVGDTVTVGQIIAVIETEGANLPAVEGPVEVLPVPEPAEAAAAKSEAQGPGVARALPDAGPVPAAPATRRLARELGVDLKTVPPTGPAGRVTPDDVRKAAEGKTDGSPDAVGVRDAGIGPAPGGGTGPAPDGGTRPGPVSVPDGAVVRSGGVETPAVGLPWVAVEPLPDFTRWGPTEIEPLRSVRRKVARKMATSTAIVAHVSHTDEADVTELDDFRRDGNAKGGDGRRPRLTLLTFVTRAVASVLKRFPQFNASLDPVREQLVFKKYYNIGVAADSGKGLVVPVVRDADRMSIVDIAAAIEDLARRARTDELTVEDFMGGTFTVSNIGSLGGFSPNPVVNYPEVAILGMGAWKERPVVRDGKVVVRKMLPLALSFDHRVADGADAARFLSELIRRLEDPHTLLLES